MSGGGRAETAPRVVPADRPRSYYGRAVLKEPVWHPEIGWYLFVGGMTGASCPLALGAELAGNEELARRAWSVALFGITISPLLLIKDLGRPERFLNMLRVFKPTSPMSVGSWVATGTGATVGPAALRSVLGRFGPALATYTAVLLADTAVPVWHEARGELPWVFAGSAMASAGGAAAVLTPVAHAGPARRLLVLGACVEGAATRRMERRLGELGEPLTTGGPGRHFRSAQVLTTLGAATVARFGRRRAGAGAGGAAVLAGSAFLRWAVFRAGFASARDPKYTVDPQRRRIEDGVARGA